MRTWLEINLILAITYLLFWIFKNLFKIKDQLQFENYFFKLLACILLLPLCFNMIQVDSPDSLIVTKQVASAMTHSFEQIHVATTKLAQKSFGTEAPFSYRDILFLFIFLGGVVWFKGFLQDIKSIQNVLKNATRFKKIGKVELYLCSDLKSPCSMWLPGRYMALIPEEVFISKKLLTHSLSHELQHHRQGDTKLIFVIEMLKAIFYINPFTHLWVKQFNENRELNCDKEVLSRKGYKAREYGSTLIDVVKISSGMVLKRTWAMASLTKITRRIEMITTTKKEKYSLVKSVTCLCLTLLVSWQALAITRGVNTLSTLTIFDIEKMKNEFDSQIPIDLNESVLKWVNYLMVNPKGKVFLNKALKRMKLYETYLKEELTREGMPLELLAVPLMESGFNNSVVSSAKAAGIWQFIPATARTYGLRVNHMVDERQDVSKLTGAAIAYYRHLIGLKAFNRDWRLALIAYNSGESRLQQEMKKQGTKNPWMFNSLGDREYLSKIIAGVIVLRHSGKI